VGRYTEAIEHGLEYRLEIAGVAVDLGDRRPRDPREGFEAVIERVLALAKGGATVERE